VTNAVLRSIRAQKPVRGITRTRKVTLTAKQKETRFRQAARYISTHRCMRRQQHYRHKQQEQPLVANAGRHGGRMRLGFVLLERRLPMPAAAETSAPRRRAQSRNQTKRNSRAVGSGSGRAAAGAGVGGVPLTPVPLAPASDIFNAGPRSSGKCRSPRALVGAAPPRAAAVSVGIANTQIYPPAKKLRAVAMSFRTWLLLAAVVCLMAAAVGAVDSQLELEVGNNFNPDFCMFLFQT
jgi:hypothetical protein